MNPSADLEIGQASATGQRASNDDFHGAVFPEGKMRRLGTLVCIADGIGSCSNGRLAAEMTVRTLLNDYYATPMTWSGVHALYQIASSINAWLFSEGQKCKHGLGTTLVATLFRGRTLALLWAGDSRLYRLRDSHLEQLSRDHVFGNKELSVLTKAVGMDNRFTPDVIENTLKVGDRYLLVTDGVWNEISDKDLAKFAAQPLKAQQLAEKVIKKAENGSDNATAVVVDVTGLPPAQVQDIFREWEEMPVIPPPKPGSVLDGFHIIRKLHDSHQGVVLLAVDEKISREVVLKFPDLLAASDPACMERFAREEWAGLRVQHSNVAQMLQQEPGRRHAAYYVQEYLKGNSLQQLLDESGKQGLPVEKVIDWLLQAAKGLLALHRKGIIHRDIKPENLFLSRANRIVWLDLGTVRIEGLPPIAAAASGQRIVGGTPGFMAPELYQGERGDALSDLFALGVTAYFLLTKRFPYGQPESHIRPSFKEPEPIYNLCPDVSQELSRVIMRCLSLERADRPSEVGELLAWLRDPTLLKSREFVPLLERNPLRFYQWGFWIFFMTTILLLLTR
jgi:protein phosphatase